MATTLNLALRSDERSVLASLFVHQGIWTKNVTDDVFYARSTFESYLLSSLEALLRLVQICIRKYTKRCSFRELP
jgi:hypothetical protein